VLWDYFIAQHGQPPAEIVLDFDVNDVAMHEE